MIISISCFLVRNQLYFVQFPHQCFFYSKNMRPWPISVCIGSTFSFSVYHLMISTMYLERWRTGVRNVCIKKLIGIWLFKIVMIAVNMYFIAVNPVLIESMYSFFFLCITKKGEKKKKQQKMKASLEHVETEFQLGWPHDPSVCLTFNVLWA